jgi:hypothetical protein
MRKRPLLLSLAGAALALPIVVSCSSTVETDEMPGGSAGAGATGGASTGGASGTPSGGTSSTSGGAGGGVTGGTAGSGVGGSGATPTGGTAGGGMGGTTAGAAGSGVAGSFVAGGMGGTPPVPALDCGGKGVVIENAGPPANRVNYAILGDGYTQEQLDAPATTAGSYQAHIQTYMTKRFSDPIGQPYLRYRKFVNICAIKVPSTPICGSSTYGCCGNDSSRLANCNQSAANTAITQSVPWGMEIDWRAVVLNGSSWWNTGATLMLWSGGNRDAAGAALHEGGHGHHQLADEYGGCSGGGQVNVHTAQGMTGGKWDAWIGFNQNPGTGMQGFFQCDGNVWRPTDNSMMNSLFGNNVNTSFNAVSREKMIMDIWRVISNPWDSVTPPAGAVTNPQTLSLALIDPAVIDVDWSVDGAMVAMKGGPTYNIGAANLAPGTHMVVARAYDNAGMDLVRQTTGMNYNRQYWATNAQKSVTWTVTIQ